MAVDTETTGLTFWDKPFCVTLAWMHEGKVVTHYWEIGLAEYSDIRLAAVLADTPELVMHNAKFDLQKLKLAGLLAEPGVVHDTQALAHLLDEHQRLALKSLAREHLDVHTVEETAIKDWFKAKKIKKADQNYADLPREILMSYAMMDVDYTIRLFNQFYPQVMADADLARMYDLEMELLEVVLRMEEKGLALDMPYLEKTAREYARMGLDLELRLRQLAEDEDFNPNSPKQVLAAFARRGINLDATSKDVLAGVDDEMADAIVKLRKVRKIHGTYLVALLHEQRDGIVHPWTRLFSTVTGRMSSGGASN